MARSDGAQPNLFEVAAPGEPSPDDHGGPVGYELTARGRQLVDPDTPDLRLVPDGVASTAAPEVLDATSGGPDGPPPLGGGVGGGADLVDDVADVGGALHARVRALRRAGTDRVEIAARLDLAPMTVAVLDAPDDLPASPVSGSAVGPGAGGLSPSTRRAAALAVVATVGHLDATGMTMTTDRIRSAAVVVQWVRQDAGTSASAIRVVLRVADQSTADIVARAWADRLGLGRDRVSTVAWPRSPGPRDVQAVVRVNGRGLADELEPALAAWPGDPVAAWPP